MTMSHTDISRLLETAIVAARLAGQRAMEERHYIHSSLKSQDELVTQADSICQKIIIDRIRETYPDHGLIAEEGPEGKMLRQDPRGGDPVWWVIDPIDGTNNFVNGLPCFTVSVAAMVEGRPIVGVVFDPATESMFTAAAGMDAQLNYSRIQVNDQEIGPFASFGIDSHGDPATAAGVEAMMAQTRFRCLGSTALHLAYVAKGALIGAVAARCRLWDIAAGALLIEQAGGFVARLDGNSLFPIYPDQYEGARIGVLASNARLKEEIPKLFRGA